MKLSPNEQRIIVASLATVAPSGGGSAIYFLMRKCAEAWAIDTTGEEHNNRVHAMARGVLAELVQAGEVIDPNGPKHMTYYRMYTELDAPGKMVKTVLCYVVEDVIDTVVDLEYSLKVNAEYVADDMLALHEAQVEELIR